MPIVEHFVSVYKLWYGYRDQFPKKSRFTLGDKIDTVFVQTLQYIFTASYQGKEEKLPSIERASRGVDLLKFFLRVAWELHILDDKKFATISEQLYESGKMLGGWKKGMQSKTPSA